MGREKKRRGKKGKKGEKGEKGEERGKKERKINKGKNYDTMLYLMPPGEIYFPPICTVPTWGKLYNFDKGRGKECDLRGKYVSLLTPSKNTFTADFRNSQILFHQFFLTNMLGKICLIQILFHVK